MSLPHNRLALVLGLGESGLAMVRHLAREGWSLRLADTRAEAPAAASLRAQFPQAQWHAGPWDETALEGVELLALSPGISPHHAPLAGLLAHAQARGIDCAGEIELFARALAALQAAAPGPVQAPGDGAPTQDAEAGEQAPAPADPAAAPQAQGLAPELSEAGGSDTPDPDEAAAPAGEGLLVPPPPPPPRARVIAITGTNGKTTTTRLIGAMLARAGRTVRVAGNISPSALDSLHDALASGTLPEFWVLELSSFQLATTHSLRCDAAVWLNLTEDHLDWHADLADYAAAKARIFAGAARRVVNRDDPATAAHARNGDGGATFGLQAPVAAGEFGLVREGGIDWLAAIAPQVAPRPHRRGAAPVPVEPGPVQRLMPLEVLCIRGLHNAANALAALAAIEVLGLPLAPALRALADYAGEPHRTETVTVHGGVEYIDDSKGTNVGATVAALHGLAVAGRRLVVILGGDGKGQSFAPLAPAVAACCRAAVLIGRDAPAIAQALEGLALPVESAPDLPAAVRLAATLAQAGDAVLLSPACASLDAFRNYAHRAEVFRAAVAGLAGGGEGA